MMSLLNEGSRNAWQGLHQWDFTLKSNNLFIKGRESHTYDLSRYFEHDLKLEEIITEGIVFIAIFKKTIPSK